jgi:hypothetical protein
MMKSCILNIKFFKTSFCLFVFFLNFSHLITCTYDGYIYIKNINTNTIKQKHFSKECYRMTNHVTEG